MNYSRQQSFRNQAVITKICLISGACTRGRFVTFQNAAVECACFAKSNTKKIWSELLNNKLRVYARKVKTAKSVRNAHTAEKPPMCNYGSALEMKLSAPRIVQQNWLPVV